MSQSPRPEENEERVTRHKVVDEKVARAFGSAFRQQMLWLLNERIASPSELAKEFGASLNRVCHHVNVLNEADCIELAFERTVGNRIQRFYKATARAFIDTEDWPRIPDSVKPGMRATLLETIVDDAVDAVVSGRYDQVDGSHMSCTTMVLDEKGREDLIQVLLTMVHGVIDVQEESRQRLEETGEAGMPYTVSALGYPSSSEERPVVPPAPPTEAESASKENSNPQSRSRTNRPHSKSKPKKPAASNKKKDAAKRSGRPR